MLILVDDSRCELLPIHVMTVGTRYDQERMDRPEGYCAHHLFCIEEGSGVFETPKGKVKLSAGSVLFIRRDYPTVYYADGPVFRTGFVTFDGDAVEHILEYYRADDFMVCHSEALTAMIGQCARMGAKNAPPDELSRATYELLIRFFHACNIPTEAPSIALAKEYIESHFQIPSLSVGEVAQAVGISQSLLFRLFRTETHMTPTEFLRRTRIRKAKQMLLRTPDIRISELAAACGFSDCAYFCKVFKAETDMTPKAFLAAYIL